MKKWINVTLRKRHGHTPGDVVGIKVWAEDNQDAITVANRIINYKKWEPSSAGPTRAE